MFTFSQKIYKHLPGANIHFPRK